ncbi:MAG: vWA domain-containing protein, partial [Acidobacteriaceae bacterium]
MKRVRYSKYTGNLADELEMESLLEALSDFLLDSGFQSPFNRFQELRGDQTLDNLRQAVRQALGDGDVFDDAIQERIDHLAAEGEIEKLIEQLLDRMEQENYVQFDHGQPRAPDAGRVSPASGETSAAAPEVRFQVTDKGLDFLGYKTLRDLLGSLGKSSFGRHDTRELSTGVEISGGSRLYEFGDTLNLDVNATLSSALAREGLTLPLNLEYSDLHVHQSEYQSSCATVVMLDCSHSMILYGEDRFTPAKRVAMALSHLVRTQYPGDTLSAVAPGSHPVSGRHTVAGIVPRLRRGAAAVATGSRPGRPLLPQHPRRPAPVAAHPGTPAQRHEADCHDHGRQAFGADAAR